MARLLIRNIDDAVIAELRVRARSKGHSLEHEAPRILAEAATTTRRDLAQRAAAIRNAQQDNESRAADLIRADRDR